MALIAPGIVRYTLSGTIGGTKKWANIWDVDILIAGEQTREDACREYAEVLMANWVQNVMLSLSIAIALTEVSWVDLDSADGSTGSINTTPLDPGPYEGAETGEAITPQTSVLVTKVASSARGSRNGRMYLAGFRESDIDFDRLDSGYAAIVQTRMDSFLATVTDPAELSPSSCLPCVVHTRNAGTAENPNIVYTGRGVIQRLEVNLETATQRRRQRR